MVTGLEISNILKMHCLTPSDGILSWRKWHPCWTLSPVIINQTSFSSTLLICESPQRPNFTVEKKYTIPIPHYTHPSHCTSRSTGALGDNANSFPLSPQDRGNTVLSKYMYPYQDKDTAGSSASILTCVGDGNMHVDMKGTDYIPNRILWSNSVFHAGHTCYWLLIHKIKFIRTIYCLFCSG